MTGNPVVLNASMIEFLSFVMGLSVALAFEPLVRWLVKRSTQAIDRRPPKGVTESEWKDATDMPTEEPGIWIGRLERALSFIAFWVKEPIIVVGWLGFKVASKWQVWSSFIRVPGSLNGTRPLDYLRATRAVGSWMAMRFLIGTISNVLAGFVGVLVAKEGGLHLYTVLPALVFIGTMVFLGTRMWWRERGESVR